MTDLLEAVPCPIQTACGWSYQELASGGEVPEIRAYKLGKKRWSYNQVELVVREKDGDRRLGVKQAVNVGVEGLGEDMRVGDLS